MGQLIHAPGREITGVDLSSGMLAKAAERGVYSSLVEAEIHGFFAASDRTYDLVIAADVLVYIGDLEDFFAGAARCLNRGGLLIVSIETTNESDFKVLPSGRFAHQLSYISRITAGRFVVEREIPTEIRLDAQGAAYGAILLLRLAPS
jgi:predicted TPR repeat methyltransferase